MPNGERKKIEERRDILLKAKLSEEDNKDLEEFCRIKGISKSVAIRMVIDILYSEKLGEDNDKEYEDWESYYGEEDSEADNYGFYDGTDD